MDHGKTQKNKETTERNKNAEMEERKRRDNGEHKSVIMPLAASIIEFPEDYSDFLQSIKKQIQTERLKATLSANSALVLMYWEIGKSILLKQRERGWGA